MKVSRIIFALLLICSIGSCLGYSQEKSKKEKSDDKKSAQAPVEVKANVMVLNADGKFADDIKPEDLKIFEDGAEQKITSFVKKENALNVGLVMDNTGSMRPILGIETVAARTFVANLRAQDEAFIVRFVSSDKIEILQNWTADKNALGSTLDDLFIEGGQSAVIDAVYLAAQEILKREAANKSKRYALVLFTDGDERDSYYEPQELCGLLKGSGLQIFVVASTQGLSDAKDEQTGRRNSKTNAEKLISSLALKTGGAAYFVQGKNKELEDSIIKSLKSILTELNSQYVIGYTSTNQKRDGLSRKLTIQVADSAKGEKRQAFVRESFVVPEKKNKK